MDDFMLHVSCFFLGLLGLGISTLLIIRNQTITARKANLIYRPKDYFRDDWFTPVVTILVLSAAEIFLHYVEETDAAFLGAKYTTLIILVLFLTLGYQATDMASKFFSVVGKRFDAAIDFKTNEADRAAGVLGTPTPATLPQKDDVK